MAAGHKIGATFDALWEAFPLEGQKSLRKSLGGNIPEAPGSGSAIRLSVALNKVGWPLEASDPFEGKEYKDKDGNFVAATVHDLEAILNKKLKKPAHVKSRGELAGTHKGSTGKVTKDYGGASGKAKRGIILFRCKEGAEDLKSLPWGEDTGFFTLWNGVETPLAEEYFDEAENPKNDINAYIWEIKE